MDHDWPFARISSNGVLLRRVPYHRLRYLSSFHLPIHPN